MYSQIIINIRKIDSNMEDVSIYPYFKDFCNLINIEVVFEEEK